MSVRLFHKKARIVLVVRRQGAGVESWWSPRFNRCDWAPVLRDQLGLLGLPAQSEASALQCPLGRIEWIVGRYWSTISVHFDRGSDIKRTLITAALLKAARYALPATASEREGQNN